MSSYITPWQKTLFPLLFQALSTVEILITRINDCLKISDKVILNRCKYVRFMNRIDNKITICNSCKLLNYFSASK